MTPEDISLALMVGVEIPIPNLQLIVHAPTITEIALMGETDFFLAMQYLCIDKTMFSQDETGLFNQSNFQILMKALEQPENKSKKIAIQTLLSILFPKYQVILMPRSINIMFDDQITMIDDNNFDEFQDVIKQVLCANNLLQGNKVVYKPKGKKAERIAKKIMEARQKIAKQKANQAKGSSALLRYLSVLRIGARIPLPESSQYNLFQLFDLITRFESNLSWDADFKIRLAGGKPDRQVESWMRDLYSIN